MSILVRKNVTVLNDITFAEVIYFELSRVICVYDKSNNELLVYNQGELVKRTKMRFSHVNSLQKYSEEPEYVLMIQGVIKNDETDCHFKKKDDTVVSFLRIFPSNRFLSPKELSTTTIQHEKYETIKHSNVVQYYFDGSQKFVVHFCQFCGYSIYKIHENYNCLKIWKYPTTEKLSSVKHVSEFNVVMKFWSEFIIFDLATRKQHKIMITLMDEREECLTEFFYPPNKSIEQITLIVIQEKDKFSSELAILEIRTQDLLTKQVKKIDLLKLIRNKLGKKSVYKVKNMEKNFVQLNKNTILFAKIQDYFKYLMLIDIERNDIVNWIEVSPNPMQRIKFENNIKWKNFQFFSDEIYVNVLSTEIKFIDFGLEKPTHLTGNGELRLEFPFKKTVVNVKKKYCQEIDALCLLEITKRKHLHLTTREYFLYNQAMNSNWELAEFEKRLNFALVNSEERDLVSLEFNNGGVIKVLRCLVRSEKKTLKLDQKNVFSNAEVTKILVGRYPDDYMMLKEEYTTLLKKIGFHIGRSSNFLKEIFYTTLSYLYTSKKFTNITICCENNDYELHREILVIRTNFFYLLLNNLGFMENDNSHKIKVEMKNGEFIFLLQYIYTGTVDSQNFQILFALLEHAQKYLERDFKRYLVSKIMLTSKCLHENEQLERRIYKYAHQIEENEELFPIVFSIWRKFFTKEKLLELCFQSKSMFQQTLLEKQMCNLILLQVERK